MAYLSAVSSLDSVVQWEINDPLQTTGGAGGGANAQAQALLNRLKYYVDGAYQSIIASVGTVLNNASYKPIIASVATVINAAKVWTTTGTGGNDGNGGQPPRAKLTFGTPAGGANTQGQAITGVLNAGEVIYYSGATNLAGTWLIEYFLETIATGLPDWANWDKLIGSGNIATTPSGKRVYYRSERIS